MRKTRTAAVMLLAVMMAGSMVSAAQPEKNTESATETEISSGAETPRDAAPDLEDGEYTVDVTLEGGSGRASVESPARLIIADGSATAVITFSSPNYDYMVVNEERYEPVNTEGNSSFEIPVSSFDQKLPVTADTVAMSIPHEIEYTLFFDSATIVKAGSGETVVEKDEAGDGESAAKEDEKKEPAVEADENGEAETGGEAGSDAQEAAAEQPGQADLENVDLPEIGESWCGLAWDHSLELQYARQFQVNYYEGGYTRIDIAEGETFLLVPEDGEVPAELEEGVTVLSRPVQNIYMVATSSMDFFSALDAMDSIRLSGTNADGWYVEKAKEAMEAGDILYAGKYSAPDYELILSEGCNLAVESTMIYHNPEVKEKLEEFGIPVLVERSSYELHPMGRTEWIKLYGALLGLEDRAEEIFEAQMDRVKAVEAEENTDKTVAFFFINSNGSANVRKSNDYVAEMITLAGGKYIFDDLGDDTALSTVNMTMEEFYARAKDADYLIYNSTIDGEIFTIDELLSKSALLADFKAVQEGHVWCTGKNLFQETTSLGNMIVDIHDILSGGGADASALNYLHKVE